MADWGPWTAEGGPIHGDIGIGRNKDGRMQAFAVGPDGSMMTSWVQK